MKRGLIKIEAVNEELHTEEVKAPDTLSKAALKELKKEELKTAIRREDSEITLREKYASQIFFCVIVYVFLVLLIIVAQGTGAVFNFFHLEVPVLVALLTTTTANILALLYLIIKYLFYR